MRPRFRAADSARGAAARVPRAATAAVAAPHAPTSTMGAVQRVLRSAVRRCSATTASREEESSARAESGARAVGRGGARVGAWVCARGGAEVAGRSAARTAARAWGSHKHAGLPQVVHTQSRLTTQLGAGGNQPLHRGAGGKAYAHSGGGRRGIAADGTRQAAQGEGRHLCGLVKVLRRGSRAGARGRPWVGAAGAGNGPDGIGCKPKRLNLAPNRRSGKRAAGRAIWGLSALRAAQRVAA